MPILWMMDFWLSSKNPQFFLMNQNVFLIFMSNASVIMFDRQALGKWKDRPEEGSTWENVSMLRKRFPTFVFEDENDSFQGGD